MGLILGVTGSRRAMEIAHLVAMVNALTSNITDHYFKFQFLMFHLTTVLITVIHNWRLIIIMDLDRMAEVIILSNEI